MKDQTRSKNIADGEQITDTLSSGTDIIEKKRAEATLQDSEERFRKVFEEGPLGVVLLGLDARIQHCNRRFCKMLAYSEEEIIALGLVGITHPDDWEKDRQMGSRLLRGEISNYTIEKQYVRKGGVTFWGQLTVSMIHDAEGKPTTVIGMVEDISGRRRAEAALRDSEERYRKLAESTTDVIAIHDRSGTLLYGNSAGAAYFGIEPGSAVGMTQQEMFPPEMVQKHTECIARVFQTGEIFETDGAYPHESGEIWINTRLIPLRDENGQVTAVMSVSRNITPRKRAEEALKQAHDELERRVEERTAELAKANQQLQREVEERKAVERTLLHSRDELQMIYNEMVEGCVIADIETKRFVRVNFSICQMLGYSEAELMAASVQNIHPPEEVTDILQRFQQAAESQRSINENRPVLRKDGTIFYADISGCRILYNGRPCVLALFRDVTERRHAQVALQESEEKYKTLVETLPDAVIMADLTGNATFVSRRLLELHRADSVDEFMGKTAWDYLVPEDHKKGHAYYQKTLNEGITRDVELSFFRMDGTRFPSELSAALVKDASGKAVAIINVLRDITERKLAEQALRQSEETHSSLLKKSLNKNCKKL